MNSAPFIIAAVILFRLLQAESKNAAKSASRALRKLRFRNGINLLGNNNYIDSRKLFIKLNRQLPNVMLMNNINVNEIVQFLEARISNDIKMVYRHNQFDVDEQCVLFNMILIVTRDNKVIEIGKGYVELQYTINDSEWAYALAKDLSQFRIEADGKGLTQNICVTGFAGSMN